MLTFEKVFSVFESFLTENGIYEITQTSHGHTILEWDSRSQEWISAKLCATPEEMAETLLDDLTGYLEYKATLGRRDLFHTHSTFPCYTAQKEVRQWQHY